MDHQPGSRRRPSGVVMLRTASHDDRVGSTAKRASADASLPPHRYHRVRVHDLEDAGDGATGCGDHLEARSGTLAPPASCEQHADDCRVDELALAEIDDEIPFLRVEHAR